jgi:putative transposase
MRIDKDLLDQLMKGREPGDLFGKDGILQELTKALAERALTTELDHHLNEERADLPPEGQNHPANRRNGSSQKTVITDSGKVVLDIPRDRNGTFDPLLIAKYQRRFPEFDTKIVSMYARGMTTREIQGHLEEIYGVEASPSLISAITDAIMEEVTAWQNRPLEPCYPVVFMDAIRIKIRTDGIVLNKAVFVALAILPDGTRDVLGLWFQANEGAKFWAKVLSDLRNRGVQDILIAVVDSLKGFPQAIEAAFPQTQIQTCIVHLLRHSMSFARFKRKKIDPVGQSSRRTGPQGRRHGFEGNLHCRRRDRRRGRAG